MSRPDRTPRDQRDEDSISIFRQGMARSPSHHISSPLSGEYGEDERDYRRVRRSELRTEDTEYDRRPRDARTRRAFDEATEDHGRSRPYRSLEYRDDSQASERTTNSDFDRPRREGADHARRFLQSLDNEYQSRSSRQESQESRSLSHNPIRILNRQENYPRSLFTLDEVSIASSSSRTHVPQGSDVLSLRSVAGSEASSAITRYGNAPSIATAITTAETTLPNRLEKLKLTSFIVRPGFGKQGRPLVINSNFFSVRAFGGMGKVIHHYDVDINPVVRSTSQAKPIGLLRAIWEQLVVDQTRPEWVVAFLSSAYDGRKNCFTPTRFPIPEGESETFTTILSPDGAVSRPRRESSSSSDDEARRFRIVMKHVAEIDLEAVMAFCRTNEKAPSSEEKCLTGLMATNVLLRDVPSKKFTQVGATGNKFFGLEDAVPLPQGAIVCKGFSQSFRYSSCGYPILNLDLAFSAFLAAGPVLDVIDKILDQGRGRKGSDGSGRDRHELQTNEIGVVKMKLRGAKFKVTHRPSTRLHTILSITTQSAQDITFLISGKDGITDRKISIVDYFQEFCQVVVRKPRMPCVQYGKRAFIPLEFVQLVEYNSLPPTKLSADQTAAMIKESAIRPEARAASTIKWRKELSYETQSKIQAWGLEVNTAMIKIQARILPPPAVLYANNVNAGPRDGSWNMRGKRYFRQAKRPLVAWSFISFDRFVDRDTIQRYVEYMTAELQSRGVHVVNKRPDVIGPINPNEPDNIKDALKVAAQRAYLAGQCPPQLICAVLPGRDAWLYEAIKKSSFTDLKGPVPTQCMQGKKIMVDNRGLKAYTENLALKIQSKIGGITHQVPTTELPGIERGRTMILGADLGHPPMKAGYDKAPTVACSIATYNEDCDMYSAQIRLQQGRSEIIQDLSLMVEAHLKIFYKNNNSTYPERILIFRDGISEGQYAAALQYEHDATIQACERLMDGYRPRILICICAKRHNTRFFAIKEEDSDRTGNLRSGLVVDKGVTHPYAFDFFLQAHTGLIGTARPTHYICLLDELAISPDKLQQLVHNMCYTFTRCTKAVSLVPVCYIADLVCQKARIIVHDPIAASTAASESSGGRSNFGGAGATGGHRGATLDIMEVQKMMAKNPELSNVAWWM